MVDITPDDDCRGVEKLLKAKGWVNIVRKLLPLKDKADDSFRDDAHPDLPIRNGTIEPCGKVYKLQTRDEEGFQYEATDLPYTTCEKNTAFTRSYLWKPGVIGDLAAKKGQLEDPKARVVSGTPEYPELLFLSSHGYPHGKFQQHYHRAKEPEHNDDYSVVFEVPKLDSGTGWAGNTLKWVIFSACNALRPELAYQWSQALRKPNGPRGILGFFSISPGPGGTIAYMTSFLQNASKPMVEAWAKANKGNPWAALVFEDAKGDTFADWTKPGLSGTVNNASGKIIYYHRDEAPRGIDVEALNPKKMLKGRIFRNSPSGYQAAGSLDVGETYTVIVARPDAGFPAGAESVEISLVNLRENWWTGGKTSPDWRKLGGRRIINSEGKEQTLSASNMRTKFGDPTKKLPDTVIVPKTLFAKWIGVEFGVPAGAYSYFYGEGAQLWCKFEAIDASGKLLAKGSTIPQGLLPVNPAVEIEIER
jgi:hypothetical protein